MIDHTPFDEHMKKQLGDFSPVVPPHIWENIMAEKDRKRPGGFLFLLKSKGWLLILLLLVLATAVIYTSSNNNENNQKTISTIAGPEKPGDQNTENTNTGSAEQKSLLTLPEQAINNTGISSTADQEIDIKTNPGNEPPATFSSARDKILISESVKNKPDLSHSEAQPAGKTQNHFIVNTAKSNNDAMASRETKTRLKQQRKSGGKTSFTSVAGEQGSEIKLTSGDNDRETTGSEGYLQKDILSLQSILYGLKFNPSIKEKYPVSLSIPCPGREKNTAGNKRYVEIYGGPDYAFRSFSDTANSIYLKRRKESTSFSSAYSAGLRFTKVFSNGMSFRAGINYSQVNEKFKFVEGNILQVIYITNAAGDTTGSYESTSTRYKTTLNKFRMLDIPVMIGYEMGNGRIHTNINAGAIINLYSWQKGDVLDKSLQPIDVNAGAAASPYQFRKNIGLGFIGAISVYYKLTDRWHLLAEPYFRYNFSPASKSELTFKQKYNTTGLRLGLRLDF
jgi:hypothetical protein